MANYASKYRRKVLAELLNAMQDRGEINDEEIFRVLYKMAVKGDLGAIQEFNNRKWGKAHQSIEHSGEITHPVEYVTIPDKSLTSEEWERKHVTQEPSPGKAN